MESSDLVIGIDLGTTNSCAAYFLNDRVELLENSDGHHTTPSFVFFPEDQHVIVGEYAKLYSVVKPERAVSEIKRFIGKQFSEIHKSSTFELLSFQVKSISDDADEPVVVIKDKRNNIEQTPQEISSHILRKLRTDVNTKLGVNIDKAVITVPAHFNVSQRKATLEAAKLAGFTVLKLLNEPTAAALSYYYNNNNDDQKYSLVYDLGGGTFDVAILQRHGANINIISVDGDSDIGGYNFDSLIVDYLCNYLKSKHKFYPESDKRIMRRLRNKCAEAKEGLSSLNEIEIGLEGIVKGVDSLEISISRVQFEEMAKTLFELTIRIVDRCLDSSKLRTSDIGEIILAGGSTRIPKIQEMLINHFNGKVLNKTVNPDECVAVGAALQAAMLSKNPKQVIKQFKMIEVTSSSLGVGSFTNEMNFIIRKNTTLPASGSITYKTVRDQQKKLTIEIYEGERMDVRKNSCLGSFKMTNLTPGPPGQCKVTITMNIDLNGILTVTANESLKENSKNLEITYSRTKESKPILLKYDENNKEHDARFVRFVTIKKFVLNYCIQVEYNMKKKKLTDVHPEIYERCQQINEIVKKMDVKDEDELKKLKKEITKTCSPIVSLHNFGSMPINID